MSDITFYCRWCRQRLVVDDAGAGMEVPCPACGKNVSIPPKPVWLPAINEALWRIVQRALHRQPGDPNPRVALRDAIVAAGYDPARAGVEPGSPEDLLTFERLSLVLDTNGDIACAFRHLATNNQANVVNAFPAWELYREADREKPRGDPDYRGDARIGWGDRWEEACKVAADDDALRVYKETGRMVATVDSDVWDHIYGDWDDSLPGNFFGAPAFGSGMNMRTVSREECIGLGLIDPDDTVKPRSRILPPAFIRIEDVRIAEWLWNKPRACDHCGARRPTRRLYVCDECEGSICPDCAAKGCSGPEPPPEPRDAYQCCSRAVDEMAGRTFPLEKDVAERVVHWYSRAFDFGFAAHHRDIEARAHRMLGEALESLGERERALREYELALEKDPQVGVKKRIASLQKDSTVCTEPPPQANPSAKAEREGKPEKQEEML